MPFSSEPSVFSQPRNKNNDNKWNIQFQATINSITKTKFSVWSTRFAGTSTANDTTPFSWFAIGF